MKSNSFRHTFAILLIASIVLFSAGCGDSSGSGSSSKNSSTAGKTTNTSAKSTELSDYILMNIDMAHDDLGGTRYDSEGVITYMINEPGDTFVTYANKADQGMYVLNIYMGYTGDYRAGESAYSLFGCRLGDTSSDVHYKLMDYGFQPDFSAGDWEYLKIYDGEWTLSYKCDNGFLSVMEVNAKKRSMKQALEAS